MCRQAASCIMICYNYGAIVNPNIERVMHASLDCLFPVSYFRSFKYCRYAPMVRVCKPAGDGLSSIRNLLDWTLLRVCIWLVAILTCTGNMFVIAYRLVHQHSGQSAHLLFVRNLCGESIVSNLVYMNTLNSFNLFS